MNLEKEYKKNYYQQNKEKIKERTKKYREDNKEKHKEKAKKYREENKEKLKEQAKKYREENKEKIRAYTKTEKGKKTHKINSWKQQGIKSDNFDEVYDRYINCNNCELCSIELITGMYGSNKKCLDHNHQTGLVRNVVCNKCNVKRDLI